MKLQPYPEYKDSGVPWLGEIPVHWESRKLRNMLTPVSMRNRPDLPLLSVVREKGIIKRNTSSKEENHNYVPDDLSNYKVVRQSQFAMNKMKAWQGSYGVSDFDGIVSPAYFVFDLDGAEARFFHAAIRSKAYVPFFTQASDGVRVGQWDLNQTRMKEIPFFVPSPDEQTQIACFLDWKTTQINKFIRNKRRLIELLNEQKRNVINQAVTRGLNPTNSPGASLNANRQGGGPKGEGMDSPSSVKLKPSGVEWIGDIPEHWEDRYFFQSFREKQVKNEGLAEQNRLSLSYGKIIRKSIDATEGLLPLSFETYQIVEKGDIILRLTDLQNDHKSLRVGLVEERGIITSAYLCLYTLPKIIPEFAYLLLHAYDLRKVFYSMGGGVRQSIGFSELKRLPFPVPPETEQADIVNFIQQESKAIDDTITRAQREIELMREYRTRLISDVVTGQVDVRGIKVPEVAEEELLTLDEDTADIDDMIEDEAEMEIEE